MKKYDVITGLKAVAADIEKERRGARKDGRDSKLRGDDFTAGFFAGLGDGYKYAGWKVKDLIAEVTRVR